MKQENNKINDVVLASFKRGEGSKDNLSPFSSINSLRERDHGYPIWKIRQDFRDDKIPSDQPPIKVASNARTGDYIQWRDSVVSHYKKQKDGEDDSEHGIEFPYFIKNDQVLEDLTSGRRDRLCRDFKTNFHSDQNQYNPTYNVYNVEKGKWLSLKEINDLNLSKIPSNATKNLMLHVNRHIESLNDNNIFGSVFDLLLLKYSSNVRQFQIILNGFRQRIAFSGNKIVGSNYLKDNFEDGRRIDINFSSDFESNNLYSNISLLLLNNLIETIFETKDSNQINFMKQKLQNNVTKCIVTFGIVEANVIFNSTVNHIIENCFGQVVNGYSVDDQKILTDALFDSGDNYKLVSFVNKIKNMKIEDLDDL
jgi:hypothetical protein